MATKALQTRVDELEKLVIALNEKITAIEENPVKKPIAEVGVVKKESKGLKKDGTPRKKRALCGYMVFSNENRSDVREELLAEAAGEKVPPGAVVKRLADMWNALDDDEKESYNTMAKKEVVVDEED